MARRDSGGPTERREQQAMFAGRWSVGRSVNSSGDAPMMPRGQSTRKRRKWKAGQAQSCCRRCGPMMRWHLARGPGSGYRLRQQPIVESTASTQSAVLQQVAWPCWGAAKGGVGGTAHTPPSVTLAGMNNGLNFGCSPTRNKKKRSKFGLMPQASLAAIPTSRNRSLPHFPPT